jgi:hypothetical protein
MNANGVFLLIMVLACASAFPAHGLSIQAEYYNSQDDIDMSVSGEGLDFGSITLLQPDSILYKNGGGSIDPNGHYDYYLALNGDPVFSGAKTDNGAFSWNAEVHTNSGPEMPASQTLSAKSVVNNGNLITYYGNKETKVTHTVQTDKSVYSEVATLNPDELLMKGSGKGGTDDSQDTASSGDYPYPNGEIKAPSISGVRQQIRAEGNGKWAEIDTSVRGPGQYVWANEAIANPSKYSLGTNLMGRTDHTLEQLQMAGMATGYPEQFLPPGDVKITWILTPIPGLEDSAKTIIQEYSDFSKEYGQESSALWYNMNEKIYVNPLDEYLGANPNDLHNLYIFKMGFSVNRIH